MKKSIKSIGKVLLYILAVLFGILISDMKLPNKTGEKIKNGKVLYNSLWDNADEKFKLAESRYLYGMDSTESFRNATFKIALMSAKKGNTNAEYLVGKMFFEGYGTERNDSAGYRWMLKSAINQYADAEYYLGMFLSHSSVDASYKVIEGKPDTYNSESFLFSAAEGGNDDARLEMAKIYLERKNYYPAFSILWDLSNAVYQDERCAEAQYYLGLMFSDGLAVKANEEQAQYWIKNSAETGNAKAKEWLEKESVREEFLKRMAGKIRFS